MQKKYVNIVTSGKSSDFMRQVAAEERNNVVFTFQQDEVPKQCDLIVVLHRSGLTKTLDLKGKNIPTLYISFEPNERSCEISRRFLSQFDYIWSSDHQLPTYASIIPTHTWWLGVELSVTEKGHIRSVKPTFDYNFFARQTFSLPPNERILVISSTKQIYPGHAKRAELIESLLRDPNIGSRIDVFGQGYRSFSDKLDLILKYRYVLVIENECKHDYWTEKLADVFLLNRQVIYVGCTNISKYFPGLRTFNFSDKDKISSEILKNNFCSYDISTNAKKLILDEYNITHQISRFALRLDKPKKIETRITNLQPNRHFTYRSHRVIFFFIKKINSIFLKYLKYSLRRK